MKTTTATTSGNQPPSGILSRLAPKKARSTSRNSAASAATCQTGSTSTVSRATTKSRIVVMAIVPVTAMP